MRRRRGARGSQRRNEGKRGNGSCSKVRPSKAKRNGGSGHRTPPPPLKVLRRSRLLLLGLVLLLLVAFDVLAPRLRADRALGLPDDVELAVLLHFADEHRLPQMVVL